MKPQIVACLLMFIGAPSIRAADASTSSPIELPPLIVDSGGTWRYGQFPGFEIISHCSDRTTLSFMQGLYRSQQLLQLFAPAAFWARHDEPHVIILAEKGQAGQASNSILRAVNQDAGRKVETLANAEFFDRDRWASFAELDHDSGVSAESIYVEPAHFREMLESRVPPLPGWAVDGICELYNEAYPPLSAQQFLLPSFPFTGPPLSFQEMLAAPKSEKRTAYSSLFLRWAFHESEERRSELWQLIYAGISEPVTEDVFRQIFKMSFADIDAVLAQYESSNAGNVLRYVIKKDLKLPEFKLADATPAQIGRFRAEWDLEVLNYVRRRVPDYARAFAAEVGDVLDKEFSRKDRDPRITAIYGLYYCELEDDQSALPYLESAAADKVVRPCVYAELARIRINQARVNAAFNNKKFTAADVQRVIEPLSVASGQWPQLEEIYIYAAQALDSGPEQLPIETQKLLANGLRYFPMDSKYMFDVARLFARGGMKSEALLLADHAAVVSTTDAERQKIAAFSGTLR